MPPSQYIQALHQFTAICRVNGLCTAHYCSSQIVRPRAVLLSCNPCRHGSMPDTGGVPIDHRSLTMDVNQALTAWAKAACSRRRG